MAETTNRSDSSPAEAIPLGYFAATPLAPQPMSGELAWSVFGFAFLPVVLGTLLLVSYDFLPTQLFTSLEVLWFVSGVLCTFSTGPVSLINYIRARCRRPVDRVNKHYRRALVGNGLFVASVAALVVADNRHAGAVNTHVLVTNATATPIDRLVVHFDSGDQTFGPFGPGVSTSSGLVWLNHNGGPLSMTVTVGGSSRTIADRPRLGEASLSVDPYTVVVEPTELPKAKSSTMPHQ